MKSSCSIRQCSSLERWEVLEVDDGKDAFMAL